MIACPTILDMLATKEIFTRIFATFSVIDIRCLGINSLTLLPLRNVVCLLLLNACNFSYCFDQQNTTKVKLCQFLVSDIKQAFFFFLFLETFSGSPRLPGGSSSTFSLPYRRCYVYILQLTDLAESRLPVPSSMESGLRMKPSWTHWNRPSSL